MMRVSMRRSQHRGIADGLLALLPPQVQDLLL
jgi:hypothetical protein